MFYMIFKNHRYLIKKALVLLGTVAVIAGCSTQKNRWINIQYHTIVAKYNAYFNGRESLRAGIATIKSMHEDRFDEMLHIYRLGTEQQAQNITPQMDRAIEKAAKVIRNHSMAFRGIEKNKYIPASYMMIADANFYKHEYEIASQSYDFIIRMYHYKPIIYQAYIKSAITNNILGNFGRSMSMLEQLENAKYDGKLNRRLKHGYYTAKADYYIKNEMYYEAANYLGLAIKSTRSKRTRIRLSYILGQVEMRNENLAAARRAFERVVRLNPPYEFEFNAKISAAMTYDAETGDRSELVALLNNMLRRDINRDFRDQIYYALAQIAIVDEDFDTAIDYLKKSTQKSVGNDRQKALSFQTIADIYYDRADYLNAGIYYDSTMRFLPTDHLKYDEVKEKHEVLSDLVKSLQTIMREDSLQGLAAMSERERLAVIDNIINEIREEERRRQQEEMQRHQSMHLHGHGRHQHGQQQGGDGGSWYFYNPQAISQGFTEFRRRWGDRKLEDNWRLSNKEMTLDFSEEMAEGMDGDTLEGGMARATDPTDRNTYLHYIPTTPEMLEESHKKIINALYTSGTIYRDGLSEYKMSNAAFEELLKRYPENKFELNTYYHLYLNYLSLDNQSQADYYKNLIVSKFPDSDHALIINDPEAYKERIQQQSEAEVFYAQLYNYFAAENYNQASRKASEGLQRFEGGRLEPKFAYINAISKGNIYNKDTLANHLRAVVNNYPGSEVAPMAQNILDFMDGKHQKAAEDLTAEITPMAVYTKNDSSIHFYVIIVNAQNIRLNDLRISFSDYNKEYHRTRNLTLSNVFLNSTHQMVTVANFPDKRRAMTYYNAVANKEGLLTPYNKNDYTHFVITVENYPIFYKDKDVDKYMRFFREHYKN